MALPKKRKRGRPPKPLPAREAEAKKNGRPVELTDEVEQQIVDAVRAGNYMEVAAAFAGISKDTLFRWLRSGARGESERFKRFSDAVKMAMASAEVRDVALVGRAAQTQWQAAAWRLERKAPDRWGRRDRVEVAGVRDAPLVVTKAELEKLSDGQLEALEAVAATLVATNVGDDGGEGAEGEAPPDAVVLPDRQ